MRTKDFPNLHYVPRTDQDGGITSKSPNRLVKPVYQFAKSLTETSSKVHKLLTYNEMINNLVYGNRWRKAIDKKL